MVGRFFGDFSLHLPNVSQSIRVFHTGQLTLFEGWSSLILQLLRDVLRWAAYGHGVVGILRLFGFYAFRNTYKPLLSQTILEFWNRFYYYYKELLLEFFFYPVYLSLSKLNPQLLHQIDLIGAV